MKPSLALGLGAAAAFFLVAPWAHATNGIVGANGKPNINYPSGDTCNRCHSGGTAPNVSLSGPATLTAGQTGNYTFTVSSGTRRAVDISATDTESGTPADRLVTLTPVSNTDKSFDEIIHSTAGYSGNGTFTFTMKAPATNGTIRIYAAGLASNNDNSSGGDKATLTHKDVTITGGLDPDAGSSGTDGGGSSSSSSGSSGSGSSGGTSSGGTSSGGTGSSGGTPHDAGGAGSSSSGGFVDDGLPSGKSGGCAMGSKGRSDDAPWSAWLAAAGVVLALAGSRRKRPPPSEWTPERRLKSTATHSMMPPHRIRRCGEGCGGSGGVRRTGQA